ncbi:hypothetical protein PUNSTDRAFT_137525 [Punctularia strigosozonata HHB-11173 SS5]|nr:uncharacterized protein PUNSTDRAFT_137525 [Punctularia strigosozonata HHB-11173 SS5]EIN05414.1 hypothetical protein PUNSTDRAFT_137525 [Punctularia strigosozonata HHB-11173 SS5]
MKDLRLCAIRSPDPDNGIEVDSTPLLMHLVNASVSNDAHASGRYISLSSVRYLSLSGIHARLDVVQTFLSHSPNVQRLVMTDCSATFHMGFVTTLFPDDALERYWSGRGCSTMMPALEAVACDNGPYRTNLGLARPLYACLKELFDPQMHPPGPGRNDQLRNFTNQADRYLNDTRIWQRRPAQILTASERTFPADPVEIVIRYRWY